MPLDTCHFELHVNSLAAARAFYLDVLGLDVLQELAAIRLLAVRAGAVRISIFETPAAAAATARAHIIFRTDDLNATIATLGAKGVTMSDAKTAPGFMRYVSLQDPSGNYFEIAQYERDPLIAT